MASGSKEFGRRIKELRKAKGLTQEQFAELVGLEFQTISRIEIGYYFTNYEKLTKFAEVFNIEIKELFEYGHLKENDELKANINAEINKMNRKELVLLYKFIRNFGEYKNNK